MILTLSCCTREFIQKVHNHLKHNNIHREANLVHGFVNKVNEHILQMIVQAKHYYDEDVTENGIKYIRLYYVNYKDDYIWVFDYVAAEVDKDG